MAHHRIAHLVERNSGRVLIWAVFVGAIGAPHAIAQSDPSQSVQGCVISGGTNTNVTQTCNFNPHFGLTPQAINNIVAAVPHDKPVVLSVIGGNRAQRMGDDLQQALAAAGLQVQRNVIGVMSPPPDDPLTIDTRGPKTLIVLYPAA